MALLVAWMHAISHNFALRPTDSQIILYLQMQQGVSVANLYKNQEHNLSQGLPEAGFQHLMIQLWRSTTPSIMSSIGFLLLKNMDGGFHASPISAPSTPLKPNKRTRYSTWITSLQRRCSKHNFKAEEATRIKPASNKAKSVMSKQCLQTKTICLNRDWLMRGERAKQKHNIGLQWIRLYLASKCVPCDKKSIGVKDEVTLIGKMKLDVWDLETKKTRSANIHGGDRARIPLVSY